MKCSLGLTNFLEEISSLSHSIVFLYFFALITEDLSYLSQLFFGILHSNGGHKQNLVFTRTKEKGAVTPQETVPDLPVSAQESGGGMGRQQGGNTALPIKRKLD